MVSPTTRPYKGVMAERTVRRLKSQIREDRGKMLKGRPRKSLEETQREMYEFDEEDQGDPFDHYYSAPYQHNHELTGVKRICRVEKSKSKVKSKVSEVSQEKLLEASLISLENVGREIQKSSNSLRDSFKDRSIADQGGVDASYQDSGDLRHPNSSYLRGALWFGRNLTMITEDLADAITEFRGKHLSEITNASKDTDYRRASYRLNLLAASGINESLALVNKSRQHVRELLQVNMAPFYSE